MKFVMQGGKFVDKFEEGTLVSNASLTRSIEVDGKRVEIFGTYIHNGDSVAREYVIILKRRSDNKRVFVIDEGTLQPGEDVSKAVHLVFDSDLYKITFIWYSGGASDGGIAQSNVIWTEVVNK